MENCFGDKIFIAFFPDSNMAPGLWDYWCNNSSREQPCNTTCSLVKRVRIKQYHNIHCVEYSCDSCTASYKTCLHLVCIYLTFQVHNNFSLAHLKNNKVKWRLFSHHVISGRMHISLLDNGLCRNAFKFFFSYSKRLKWEVLHYQ